MWKRDESVRPTSGGGGGGVGRGAAEPVMGTVRAAGEAKRTGRDVVNIGKSVVIKGELNGSEDLTIEGRVEGKIELRQNVLTIGPNGKIKAEVFAKSVVVLGEMTGNVTATEKVDIRDHGSVDGDISSPLVAIAEGAHFRGSVDMQRGGKAERAGGAKPRVEPKSESKSESKSAPAVASGGR